jgi:diguanylate cyclase (GGDEF)-like protein
MKPAARHANNAAALRTAKRRRRRTRPYSLGRACATGADPSPQDGPRDPKAMIDGRVLLVVEDDRSARLGFALLLRSEGYDVVAVESAEDGVERLRNGGIDLVLCDVNLPGMSGYDLTAIIRRQDVLRDVPIILMSAVGGSERKVTGLDVGADDFMVKPVDPEELGARIRVHLRRARRNAELKYQSMRDPLTGLLNRRSIEEELRRELRRMSRTGLPVSLMMVDLDHFKEINDCHGHVVGDEALRRVAVKLEASVRNTDRVARFGGDEFLIVLPDTDEAQLAEMKVRLGLAWRRHPPMVPNVPRPVMASFGGATAEAETSVEALIRRADQAMFKHKRSTRPQMPKVTG